MKRPSVLVKFAPMAELIEVDGGRVRVVHPDDEKLNPEFSIGSLLYLAFWALAHQRTRVEVPHLYLNLAFTKDQILDAGENEVRVIAARRTAMGTELGIELPPRQIGPNPSGIIQRGTCVLARDPDRPMTYHFRTEGAEETPPAVTWPLFAELMALALGNIPRFQVPALLVNWLPVRPDEDWEKLDARTGVVTSKPANPLPGEVRWSALDGVPNRFDLVFSLADVLIPALDTCVRMSPGSPILVEHLEQLKRLRDLMAASGALAIPVHGNELVRLLALTEEVQVYLFRTLATRATLATRVEAIALRREAELMKVKAEAEKAVKALEAEKAALLERQQQHQGLVDQLATDREALGRDRGTLETEKGAVKAERDQLGTFETDLLGKSEEIERKTRRLEELKTVVHDLRELAGQTVEKLVAYLTDHPAVAKLLLTVHDSGESDGDIAAQLLS